MSDKARSEATSGDRPSKKTEKESTSEDSLAGGETASSAEPLLRGSPELERLREKLKTKFH